MIVPKYSTLMTVFMGDAISIPKGNTLVTALNSNTFLIAPNCNTLVAAPK